MKSKFSFWQLALLFFPFFVNGQIINVDNPPYNAVGDGVTDDHDAIQSAIWDLRSAGGTLQFTSGKTYIIGSGLTFNTFPADKNYLVTSSGTEKATIKVQDGAPLTWDHWGIRLSESRNVTLRNLTIDGNRDTRNPVQEYSGVDVLFIDGKSNGTRLENLNLINSPADNIYIVVHYNQNQTPMTDFEMYNCKLDNGFRNNMSVISGSNFKIVACEFTNANGTPPESGIDFEPNANTDPYMNMLVDGCLFKGNNRFGIELTHIVDGCGSSIIKNNLFVNNGILIASKNNAIHHNIFVDQNHQHAFGNDTRDGIIYFHTGTTATGNDVFNNYFYDNNMPAGSHLIKFMYNSGGSNWVHENYEHNNNVAGFVADDTNPATNPGQTIGDNITLPRREMGFWNMDAAEITNFNINDLSFFHNDGVITGATSIVGVQNEGLDFAPDDKYITIPTHGNLDIEKNFTVMAWVKWNGTNGDPEQVFLGRDTDWRFGVSNDGKVGFHGPLTPGLIESPIGALPLGQWKLVTATYNGRQAKIYIDDQEVAAQQTNGNLGFGSSNMYIGGSKMTTNSFNGAMDNVRIYNYALSLEEISNFFAAITPVDNPDLQTVAIYPNPVRDSFYFDGKSRVSQLKIYTMSGVEKISINQLDNGQVIDVSNLETGIYILVLTTANGLESYKMIVE